MEESIVERVLILMKNYELTASEFADKIDVQRSSMSHLVSGRNKPSLDFIQKILNNFSDLNPTWLIMGTGPMKQLDLFDTKGDVAPIQPIPAENFRVESTVTARPSAPTFNPEDDSATISDTKKVVYTQSAPTLAAIPDPVEYAQPIQIETSREASVQTPVASVAPIAAPAVPVATNPPAQQPPATASTVIASENHQEVAAKTEKSASNDKKVVKIVFFYSDNTFESFNPQ